MIDKLRKKIFWIIQISLSTIILGVIIIFASIYYKNTISFSVMMMDRFMLRNEIHEINEIEFGKDPFYEEYDGIYKFIIIDSKVDRETTNVTDELRNYAIKISNKKTEEGYYKDYLYKVRMMGNNEKEIILMENENTINRLKFNLIMAIGVGIAGIMIVYVIAQKISQTIVEPVEESFEKQKQFVSDASHELKTPLAVIEANADVLQDKDGDNKWIGYIQNEVQSMNKLVNDLLTLAKMENVNNDNYQKFDLSKEVQMEVAVFESMIYEKDIVLKQNIEEGILFNGESDDIKHVVSIILDNAIKHTDKNKEIIVSVEKEKNDVKITISNQGKPIVEEDRERIFERFYRVDKARNRNEKRYGLGLAIAKEIVEKYRGTISAFSENGYTSFIVKLTNK
ncbi:MAG: HAMP domain-containing histidine kinase [Clostridia bacterium]|nr:HAMP domain-containing histidine kinase [Clostridia bacterium]